jgi:hypothetical protein
MLLFPGKIVAYLGYYPFGKDVSPIDLWIVYATNRTISKYTTELLPLLVP